MPASFEKSQILNSTLDHQTLANYMPYCKIKVRTKFSYKIDCNLKLQPYSISFYWW